MPSPPLKFQTGGSGVVQAALEALEADLRVIETLIDNAKFLTKTIKLEELTSMRETIEQRCHQIRRRIIDLTVPLPVEARMAIFARLKSAEEELVRLWKRHSTSFPAAA